MGKKKYSTKKKKTGTEDSEKLLSEQRKYFKDDTESALKESSEFEEASEIPNFSDTPPDMEGLNNIGTEDDEDDEFFEEDSF